MTNKGIPYSVGELRAAAEQPMDIYYRELMRWAADSIDDLKAALTEALKGWERALSYKDDFLPRNITYDIEYIARLRTVAKEEQ